MRLISYLTFAAPMILGLSITAPAQAAFHLWKIDEVFSNSSGTVQYIELFNDSDFEHFLQGHQFTTNANTFAFPSDLPSSQTANTHFLMGTSSVQSVFGVTPDYMIPDQFFSTSGDLLNFAGVDSFSFNAAQLPVGGFQALHRDPQNFALSTGPASPTNFAGQTGTGVVPEPSGLTMLGLGLGGLVGSLVLGRFRSLATPKERWATPLRSIA